MDKIGIMNKYIIYINTPKNDNNFNRLKNDLQEDIIKNLHQLDIDIIPNINDDVAKFEIYLTAGSGETIANNNKYESNDIIKYIKKVKDINEKVKNETVKNQTGGKYSYRYKYKKYKAKYINLKY